MLDVLPAESVALKVTVVTPSGNTDGALLVTFNAPSTVSVAVAAFKKAVIAGFVAGVPDDENALTVISSGTVITGGVWSLLICVNAATIEISPLTDAISQELPLHAPDHEENSKPSKGSAWQLTSL